MFHVYWWLNNCFLFPDSVHVSRELAGLQGPDCSPVQWCSPQSCQQPPCLHLRADKPYSCLPQQLPSGQGECKWFSCNFSAHSFSCPVVSEDNQWLQVKSNWVEQLQHFSLCQHISLCVCVCDYKHVSCNILKSAIFRYPPTREMTVSVCLRVMPLLTTVSLILINQMIKFICIVNFCGSLKSSVFKVHIKLEREQISLGSTFFHEHLWCQSGIPPPPCGKWVFPCHWARQCPIMAQSLNLTGEEEFETIFIPVISVLVSKRLVHAMGTVLQKMQSLTVVRRELEYSC